MIQTYSLSEQQRIISLYAHLGVLRSYALLMRRSGEIEQLAKERLIVGHAEYGDEMFHQSLDDLRRESLEELADCVNRQAVYEWKEKHANRTTNLR